MCKVYSIRKMIGLSNIGVFNDLFIQCLSLLKLCSLHVLDSSNPFLLNKKSYHVCFNAENQSSDSAQHGPIISGWRRSICLIKMELLVWLVGTQEAWWLFFLTDSPLINSAHSKGTCWNQDVTLHLRRKSLRSLIGYWILYSLSLWKDWQSCADQN